MFAFGALSEKLVDVIVKTASNCCRKSDGFAKTVELATTCAKPSRTWTSQASQHDPPRITRLRANMGVDYTRDEPARPNIAMEPTARRKSSYAPRLIARSLDVIKEH